MINSPQADQAGQGEHIPLQLEKKSMVHLNLSIINSNLGHDNRLLLLKGFTFTLRLLAHVINTTEKLTVIS